MVASGQPETAMDFLEDEYAKRPIWMHAIFLFCLYMTFIYVPWDLFIKPLDEDKEVWFGLLFEGWAAKAGAVAHWAVYGAGAWGFYRMRAWMHPWAGLYVAQVALSMFLWTYPEDRGGIVGGLIAGGLFMALAIALWVARDRFATTASPGDSSPGSDGDDEYDEEYEDSDDSDVHRDDDDRRWDGPSEDSGGDGNSGSSDDT